ncbi:hypothetical protein FLSI110296_13335 [Flavobacterium sinopsychrotolerans]|uniref:Peptidase C58 YopT-type domain-containing protein n=1 Tax=Flavobacterium sinopsychrotolerans TaxID=604089 RepID=A0A1H8R256_9FLAO|nr:hypothetical protein [Flavobacterium sinopsychrotolerans]SEO60426.1 hypothetical protein SAMN04487942_3176 [Flavobacterium sinopsychrotolerans]
MVTKNWKNTTATHPNGVCEAATSIWLQQIATNGIVGANSIVATDCDVLQAKCENGTYTWAVDLIDLLGASNATFDAFNGPTINTKQDMLNVLKSMNDNNFRFISATNQGGNGHATALYKFQGTIYFFDPNYAIYSIGTLQSELDLLANQIMSNLSPWTGIAVRLGEMLN